MFYRKTVQELEAAIDHLESILTNGAQSASDAEGGEFTGYTPTQMRQILSILYDRYEEKTGTSLRDRRMTIVNIRTRRR